MDPHVEPYLKVLEDLHGQILETIAPLSDEEINRPIPGLQNTIGILLRHLGGSERYWIGEVVGGQPAQRNRESEFGRERLHKAALLEELERTKAITRETLGRLRATDLLAEVDVRRTRGVRKESRAFALLHATQHLAYHLGQLRYLAKLLPTAR
ncbi:MAG: DinB family protein [Armatimonadetes bacterium]|nr:DinB family protein [Armatimonadota bacterium]